MSELDDSFFLVLKGIEDRIEILESKKFKISKLYEMYLIDLKFLHEFIASISLEESEETKEEVPLPAGMVV